MFKAVHCDLVRGRMILRGWTFTLWMGLRYALMFHVTLIEIPGKLFPIRHKILGPKTRYEVEIFWNIISNSHLLQCISTVPLKPNTFHTATNSSKIRNLTWSYSPVPIGNLWRDRHAIPQYIFRLVNEMSLPTMESHLRDWNTWSSNVQSGVCCSDYKDLVSGNENIQVSTELRMGNRGKYCHP